MVKSKTPGSLRSQATGGFYFASEFWRVYDDSFPPARLQRLHIGNHILDLLRFQAVLESRHQLVAVFNPRLQSLVRNLVAIHAEGAALGDALQARSDFLLVARVVM